MKLAQIAIDLDGVQNGRWIPTTDPALAGIALYVRGYGSQAYQTCLQSRMEAALEGLPLGGKLTSGQQREMQKQATIEACLLGIVGLDRDDGSPYGSAAFLSAYQARLAAASPPGADPLPDPALRDLQRQAAMETHQIDGEIQSILGDPRYAALFAELQWACAEVGRAGRQVTDTLTKN